MIPLGKERAEGVLATPPPALTKRTLEVRMAEQPNTRRRRVSPELRVPFCERFWSKVKGESVTTVFGPDMRLGRVAA